MTDTTTTEPEFDILARIPDLVKQTLTSEETATFVGEVAAELGVSADAARRYIVTSIGIAATTDPEQFEATHDAIFKAAAEAKEKWAVEVLSALNYLAMKPTYEKALELGAKPVDALIMGHKLSRTDARKVVKFFEAQATGTPAVDGETTATPDAEDADES
jgi:hypothetical protein